MAQAAASRTKTNYQQHPTMKLTQTKLTFTAFAVIIACGWLAYAAEEQDETVTLDKVPQKVKDTLKQYAADADVKKISKGDQDGTKVYEFVIEQGTHKFELTITPKGKFMGTEEDVQLSDMPQAAQAALKAKAVDGKLSGFEKAVDKNHHTTYEADIEKDGKTIEVAVDETGKVMSTEAVTPGKGD
jgi:hypothetical protein